MKENIDLTKILKNCPKGFKLYSTIYGEVEFIECDLLYQIVVAKEDKYYYFTSQGAFIFERIKYHLGECVLFPSKEQRDWSKFTAPWYKKDKFEPKTLKPFDKVIARCSDFKWVCDMFSHYDKSKCVMPYVCVGGFYEVCIPYNSDTKHLIGTTEEAPEYYRYWEDSHGKRIIKYI